MIKTSNTLQELRRKIYIKAKAEKAHRFWGLYVHVCKLSTLAEAYQKQWGTGYRWNDLR
jgi:RNA-directed DNA polymerase